MKILVCVKHVPDMDSFTGLNEDSTWINESKPAAYKMNSYDEHALEAALLMKDIFTDITIDALTVGPPRSSSAVRKALEKGADSGFHIIADNNPPAAETAALISEFARHRDYDIILTGVMSEDLMQFQTGPAAAAMLGIPFAVSAVSIRRVDENRLDVHCEIDGGYTEKISLLMPCLVTVQTGTARPRYPSLSNKMRAKGIEIVYPDILLPHDFQERERFSGLSEPVVSTRGIEIKGSSAEKAVQLIDILHERGLI